MLDMLIKRLFVALFLLFSYEAFSQSKIALANLENATTVEGTKAGQIPLSNTSGVLRYAQFVEIEPTPLAFNPASTGNSSNLSEFVTGLDGFLYYIDWQGRAIQITSSSSSVNTSSPITGNGTIGTPITLSPGSSTNHTYKWDGSSWALVVDADNSITNESLTITDGLNSEALGGQTIEFRGTGIINNPIYNPADNSLTYTATEADGNISNEGVLSVQAGTSTTSIISSNSLSSNPITISNGGGLLLSENTGTSTITITALDSSPNNEGTLSVGSGDVNDANIISSTGGSFVVVSGSSNINITENTGTNTITAEAALPTGQVYIGNSSSIAQGRTLSGDASVTTTGTVTVDKIDNTQVVATGASDGQVLKWNNSLSRWEAAPDNTGGAGSTDLSITNRTSTTLDVASSSGMDATVPAATTSLAGVISASDKQKIDYATITQAVDIDLLESMSHDPVSVNDNAFIDFTLVNQSLTAQLAQNGATTNQVIKWNGSIWAPANDAGITITDGVTSENLTGQTLEFRGVGGMNATYNSTDNAISYSYTEGDGSTSNEGILSVQAGTGTTSLITTNSTSATTVTLSNGGGLLLNENTGTNTITITALDQSATNEGMLSVNSANSNSSYISSNSGNFIEVEGARGLSVTENEATDVITLTNTLNWYTERFSSTAGQTNFVITFTPPAAASPLIPLRVFRNGVELEYVVSAPTATQFTYTGATVTTLANTLNDIITIKYLN